MARFGTSVVSDIRLGGGPIQRVYKGGSVVWTRQVQILSNPIPDENALAGVSDTTVGRFTVGAGTLGFFGYAKQFSVNVGQTVQFAVDGTAATNIAIHRIGHYGGQRWRLVQTIPNNPTAQPDTLILPNSAGSSTASNWSVTASWNIPPDAVSGLYIGVVRDISNAPRSWIIFIVREDNRRADIVLRLSDSTWGGAYNAYGSKAGGDPINAGKSVYGQGKGNFGAGARGVQMSYDRPIATRPVGGGPVVNHWDEHESALIDWIEKNGYNVKYISCYDLDQGLTKVGNAKILANAGHDEYWSDGMYNNTEAFIDSGGHHVSMSANTLFWRIRWADSGRTFWCYKDTLDGPSALRSGGGGTPIDPVSWTGTWRDTRWPNRRPENLLLGATFRMNGVRNETMVVDGTEHRNKLFWRNTTVANGTTLTVPQVIGFEADSLDFPNSGGVNLGRTTININGSYADDNGANYGGNGDLLWGIACHYPRSTSNSGLSIHFSTNQWMWGLSDYHIRGSAVNNREMRQATYNMLTDLGAIAATKESDLTTVTAVPLSSYGATRPVPVADVSITVAPSAVAEDGTTNIVFTFTRTLTAGAINVNYSISGSAVNGVDYATITSPVVFGAGNATATVVVDPIADATAENNETVTITLAPGTGYLVRSPNTATATINSDDVGAVPYQLVPDSVIGIPELGDTATAYTLGTAFSVTNATNLQSIRLYRVAGSSRTWTLQLWDQTTSSLIGSATVSSSGAAGWLEAPFIQEPQLLPGVGYIAAYVLPSNLGYSYQAGYFSSSITPGSPNPLSAPASAGRFVAAPNGSMPTTSSTAYYLVQPVVGTAGPPVSSVTIAVSPSTVAEDGTANLIYTFTRTISTGTLSVNYSISGTATNGTDYATITSPVVFADGSATATVVVDPIVDAVSEANEAVVLTVTAGPGYSVGNPSIAIGTIQSGQVGIPVSIFDGKTLSPLSFNDGIGQSFGTVFSVNTSTDATGVKYWRGGAADNQQLGTRIGKLWRLSDSTELASAIFDTDTTATPGWKTARLSPSVPLTAGVLYMVSYGTQGNYVYISNYFTTAGASAFDGLGDDRFTDPTGLVYAPSGPAIGGGAPSTVVVGGGNGRFISGSQTAIPTTSFNNFNYLVDIEVAGGPALPATPVVSLAVSPGSVNENGTANLIYTFTRTVSTGALSVDYSISGTAINGTDYATITSPVVFADGSATATVVVDPTPDAVSESNETVILTVLPGTGYVPGGISTATGTIIGDIVQASGAINYSTVDLPLGTTNKQANLGFVPTAGNKLIAIGVASATFSVPAGWTMLAQGLGGFVTVVFTKTSNGLETGISWSQNGARQAKIAFLEFPSSYADAVLVGSVNLVNTPSPTLRSYSSPQLNTSAGSLIFISGSTLNEDPTRIPIGVRYTATGDLTELVDGESSSTKPVAIGNEVARLFVGQANFEDGPKTANWNIIPSTATGNHPSAYDIMLLAAVSGPPLPFVTVTVSPASTAEDAAGNLTFTFTRTITTGTLSVNYSIGGTATNGEDYATITSPVIFADGSATATVVVDPTPDVTSETNETVVLTVTAGSGYSSDGIPASGIITNDDVAVVGASYQLLPDNIGTTAPAFADATSSELGTQFTVNSEIHGTAIKFYRPVVNASPGAFNARSWRVIIWQNGQPIASGTATTALNETGWITAQLSQPVLLSPGITYTASMGVPVAAGYPGLSGQFTSTGVIAAPPNPLGAPTNAGRYSSGRVQPSQTFGGNYYMIQPVVTELVTPPRVMWSAQTLVTTGSVTSTLVDALEASYEMGVRYTITSGDTMVGARFWRSYLDTGTNTVKLWNNTGSLLASATASASNNGAGGYVTVSFGSPVQLSAGQTFVVSVNTNGTVGFIVGSANSRPVPFGTYQNSLINFTAGLFPTTTANSNGDYLVQPILV